MAIFKLQIVYPDGSTLQPMTPGKGNPFEIELIKDCKAAILAKGVGIGRTETQVAHAIEAGMTEAILALKVRARMFKLLA